MAKYFTFNPTIMTAGVDGNGYYYSVYYDEVNPANLAKFAYQSSLVESVGIGVPSPLGSSYTTVEVPDTATSIIVQNGVSSQTFSLLSSPPTVGTLFITFDTL